MPACSAAEATYLPIQFRWFVQCLNLSNIDCFVTEDARIFLISYTDLPLMQRLLYFTAVMMSRLHGTIWTPKHTFFAQWILFSSASFCHHVVGDSYRILLCFMCRLYMNGRNVRSFEMSIFSRVVEQWPVESILIQTKCICNAQAQ